MGGAAALGLVGGLGILTVWFLRARSRRQAARAAAAEKAQKAARANARAIDLSLRNRR